MLNETTKKKILIIDDERGLRQVLSILLKPHRFDCDLAENGQVGLELLKTNRYDAVLCDIHMPNMNGFECLANANHADMKVPFVFITGFADLQHVEKGLKLGAFDFVFKPFDHQAIIDVLGRAIRSAEERRIAV